MNIIQIAFDALGKSTVTLTKNIQQGDHLTNKLRVTFYEGHPTISTVRLHAQKPDGSVTPIISSFESAFQDDIWEYKLESWFTEYAGILTISVSVQFAGEVEGYETADIILYDDYAALDADGVTDDTKALVTLDDSKVFVYDTGTSTYEEQTGLSYEIPKEYQRSIKLSIEKSVISSGTSNLPPTSEPYILLLINNNATRISIIENTSNDHEERLDAAEPIIASNTSRIVTLESDKADKTELAVETLRIDRILDGTTIVPKAYADEDGTNIKANYARIGELPNIVLTTEKGAANGVAQLDSSSKLPNATLQNDVAIIDTTTDKGIVYWNATEGKIDTNAYLTYDTSEGVLNITGINVNSDFWTPSISKYGSSNGKPQINFMTTTSDIELISDTVAKPAVVVVSDIDNENDIVQFKQGTNILAKIDDGGVITAKGLAINGDAEITGDLNIAGDMLSYGSMSISLVDDSQIPFSIIGSPTQSNDFINISKEGVDVFKVTSDGSTYTNNLNVAGDIIQQGSAYETHAEQVYTTSDEIILRDGAVGGLAVGSYAGLRAKLADGTNDSLLQFDGNGIARVGDEGNTQALATRQDSPTSNGVPYWNASANRFDTSSGLVLDLGDNANAGLLINKSAGAGNIANFQFGGANKLEITKDGFITQNGTSILSVSATNRNAIGFGASATENNSIVLGNTDITKTILRGAVDIYNGATKTAYIDTNGTYFGGLEQTTASKNKWYGLLGNSAGQVIAKQFTQRWNGSAYVADNSYGFGQAALSNNTGAYSNGFGQAALSNNTGAYSNGFGQAALSNNTGANSNGFGYYALYNNTGAYSNGFGYSTLYNNTGTYSNGFGHAALYNNTGGYSNGFGLYALNSNTGANSNGFGFYALRYNQGANNTAIGDSAFGLFYDNTDGNKSCDYTAVDIGNEQVTTITNHGFGATNAFVNIKYASTTGDPIGGLTVGTVYQVKIIDADTIEFRTGGTKINLTSQGTGTHTFTPQYTYTNTTAIGYNAQPTASNQIVLGDANITQVKTTGAYVSTIATGNAPLIVSSTTLVSNLNADLLDGNEASAFATSDHTQAVNKGGTNLTAYTKGDIIYASASTTLNKLEIGTENQVLSVSATGIPTWKTGGTSYAGVTETNLATRTTVGTFAVTALDTYDYIILRLNLSVTNVVDDTSVTETYTEEAMCLTSKISYSYTDKVIGTPRYVYVYNGAKLTSVGHENGTPCQFTLLPQNTDKTSVTLAIHGTAPTGWTLRVIGVNY